MATTTTVSFKIGLWVVTGASEAQVRSRLSDVRTTFQTELVAEFNTRPGFSLLGGEAAAVVKKPRGDYDQQSGTFGGSDYVEVAIYLTLDVSHPDGVTPEQLANGLHGVVRDILKGSVKDEAIGNSGATIRKFFYTSSLGRVEEDG